MHFCPELCWWSLQRSLRLSSWWGGGSPVSQYKLSPMEMSPGGEIYILLQSLPGHVDVSYPIIKSPPLCKSLRSRSASIKIHTRAVKKNTYECTMDQELANATAVYTPGRRCVCTHQVTALFCVKWRHGSNLDRMTSCQKSDSVIRCNAFAWRTFLPNFIPIRFETTKPWALLKRSCKQELRRTTTPHFSL